MAAGERPATWMDRIARGSLVAGCLATIVIVASHLVLMPRARSAPPIGIGIAAQRQPYSPSEERRYRFRAQQLEQDLESAPHEYGVIVKLGVLYTRLGVRQRDPARRAADLAHARDLYERATQEGVAAGRRDFEYAAFQLERIAGRYPLEDGAAEQPPSSDPIATATPMMWDVEETLHMRLAHTRSTLARLPDSARFYCRLGWICYRLAQIMRQRDVASPQSWLWESARKKPEALLEEAVVALQRAARLSSTREYRVEAYQGLAAVYQSEERWEEAVGALQKVVALQPNHWVASQRMASILGRLGRPEEARRALKMADSWRTSEWL
jgi:tetratricopeptide (TPR) repeat protein